MIMKFIPFATTIAKAVAKNRQRKHDFKMATLKKEVAKEENKAEVTTKLAELDALEMAQPQGIGARINKFIIGLMLAAMMGGLVYAIHKSANGDPDLLDTIIRLIQVLEASPTVFLGSIGLIGLYAGGRAIASAMR